MVFRADSVGPTSPVAHKARLIVEAYDADRNGLVEPAEADFKATRLDRLDLSRSGAIHRQEIETALAGGAVDPETELKLLDAARKAWSGRNPSATRRIGMALAGLPKVTTPAGFVVAVIGAMGSPAAGALVFLLGVGVMLAGIGAAALGRRLAA